MLVYVGVSFKRNAEKLKGCKFIGISQLVIYCGLPHECGMLLTVMILSVKLK